ncbi:9683_t:CDS:2, partial [Funneliformis caledonium]
TQIKPANQKELEKAILTLNNEGKPEVEMKPYPAYIYDPEKTRNSWLNYTSMMRHNYFNINYDKNLQTFIESDKYVSGAFSTDKSDRITNAIYSWTLELV